MPELRCPKGAKSSSTNFTNIRHVFTNFHGAARKMMMFAKEMGGDRVDTSTIKNSSERGQKTSKNGFCLLDHIFYPKILNEWMTAHKKQLFSFYKF